MQDWEAFSTAWAVPAPSPTEEELDIEYSTEYQSLSQDKDDKNLATDLLRTTSGGTASESSSDSSSVGGGSVGSGTLEGEIIIAASADPEAELLKA